MMTRCFCSVPALCALFTIAGCGSQSFLTNTASNSGDLLAVKVADYAGPNALSAKANAATEQADTVSLPAELTQDTVDAAVIALAPADIVVALDGATAKLRSVIAKGKPSHAGVVFRLAGVQDDACLSDVTVGPFELTIEDGTVTVDPSELPIPAEALALFRDGQLALCAETQADFDGTISLGKVGFETGRLHGDEERVTLCHMPPGQGDEPHTITVGSSAVDAHLAHGDQLGECDGSGHDHQGGENVGNDGADSHVHQDDGSGHDAETDNGDQNSEGHAESGDQVGADGERDSANDAGDSSDARDDGDLEAGDGNSSNDMGDEIQTDDENMGASEDDGQADNTAPTDLDGDGMVDGLDQCPNTPSGETVDAVGCSCSQKDADGDGVNDCTDTCMATGTGSSIDANGCASNQLDDDGDGVMNDADTCPNTAVGTTVDVNGCSCGQLDADGDGVDDCTDSCSQTPAGESVDANGCSTSQLTATVTVPGPTDIYLAGQPDGTTATWPFTGFTSNAPQHSPKMIDVSAWAGKELRFSATGVVVTGGNNAATPDGRNWVLRPNGLSQVFGLTAMTDYQQGALVGAFLTAAPPTPGLLPYMSSSGITTTTPLLQHIFVIGTSSQVVIPTGATRLFFGVAEQQGLVIDNSGSFDVTVEAVPHALLPPDPLAATRFYVGDPTIPRTASAGSTRTSGRSTMTSTARSTSPRRSDRRATSRWSVIGMGTASTRSA